MHTIYKWRIAGWAGGSRAKEVAHSQSLQVCMRLPRPPTAVAQGPSGRNDDDDDADDDDDEMEA